MLRHTAASLSVARAYRNQMPTLQVCGVAETRGVKWLRDTIFEIKYVTALILKHGGLKTSGGVDVGHQLPPLLEHDCALALLQGLPTSVRQQTRTFVDHIDNCDRYGTAVLGAFELIAQKAMDYEIDAQSRANATASLRVLEEEEEAEEPEEPASEEDSLAYMGHKGRGKGRGKGGTKGAAPSPSASPAPQVVRRCWNCDEEGHFARNCPHPVTKESVHAVSRDQLFEQQFPAECTDFFKALIAAKLMDNREPE